MLLIRQWTFLGVCVGVDRTTLTHGTRVDRMRSLASPMSTARADRTAIRRPGLSRPVALAVDDGFIHQERSFFDYGCGRGDDLLRLHRMGIPVSGWDPAFFPDEKRSTADIVNLGWVRLFFVGGPERSRRGCERHGKSYLTRRRRGEEGDGCSSLTGGAIPSA